MRVRQGGSTLTGFAASEQAAENPLNTFSSVKRLIGRRYEDVVDRAAQLPYGIAASGGGGDGGGNFREQHTTGTLASRTERGESPAAGPSGAAQARAAHVVAPQPVSSAAQQDRGYSANGSGEAGAAIGRTDAPGGAGTGSRPGLLDSGSGAVMLQCPALGRLLAPEEVSAALLRELADRARRHVGADLTGAVRSRTDTGQPQR